MTMHFLPVKLLSQKASVTEAFYFADDGSDKAGQGGSSNGDDYVAILA